MVRRPEVKIDSPKSNSKPKMSKEEQERHKADGMCFHCRQAGHFSCNCPDLNKVPSSSMGSTHLGYPPSVGVSTMARSRIRVNDRRLRRLTCHWEPLALLWTVMDWNEMWTYPNFRTSQHLRLLMTRKTTTISVTCRRIPATPRACIFERSAGARLDIPQ